LRHDEKLRHRRPEPRYESTDTTRQPLDETLGLNLGG